jgi:C4-dicarboxylate-specific signal transduction histidine kinase
LRSKSAIRELKSRNSKFERPAWPELVEIRDGFEAVCLDLVERLVCSEPPELIEWAVALEARDARAAVELEAVELETPDSRHNLQAVEGMAADRAWARSAQGEPVRSVEARDEAARSAWREKARGCGAGSGSREVARQVQLSARKSWALCAARILHWQSNVQYRSGNTENRWGIVVDIKWYGTSTDVEDLKRAEEALSKSQAELAHVTRVTTMGELAASIAHEVNQPLSAIVNNGSACLRWLDGVAPNLDEAREAARRIIRDGNRAGEVTTRIRALLRKTDKEKARLDINQTIQEVVMLARNEAARKGVTLRMDLAADLPPVLGDRVQLQQVILNLVMNGVEAMASALARPRELLIHSRQYESDKALVAVRDSGVGLDGQDLEKIFDAFYTTKPQGMGMGLAISRSIVEDHGGRLWAAPNDGPGATFQFTLLKHQ